MFAVCVLLLAGKSAGAAVDSWFKFDTFAPTPTPPGGQAIDTFGSNIRINLNGTIQLVPPVNPEYLKLIKSEISVPIQTNAANFPGGFGLWLEFNNTPGTITSTIFHRVVDIGGVVTVAFRRDATNQNMIAAEVRGTAFVTNPSNTVLEQEISTTGMSEMYVFCRFGVSPIAGYYLDGRLRQFTSKPSPVFQRNDWKVGSSGTNGVSVFVDTAALILFPAGEEPLSAHSTLVNSNGVPPFTPTARSSTTTTRSTSSPTPKPTPVPMTTQAPTPPPTPKPSPPPTQSPTPFPTPKGTVLTTTTATTTVTTTTATTTTTVAPTPGTTTTKPTPLPSPAPTPAPTTRPVTMPTMTTSTTTSPLATVTVIVPTQTPRPRPSPAPLTPTTTRIGATLAPTSPRPGDMTTPRPEVPRMDSEDSVAPTTTSTLSTTDSLVSPQSDSAGGAVGTSEREEDSGIDNVGLGVGIGAAVLFLFALMLLVIALLMRRRRRQRAMQPLASTSDTSSGAGRLSEYGSTELVSANGKGKSVPQYGGVDLSNYAPAPGDVSVRSHEYGAFSDSQREQNKAMIQYDAIDTPL